MVSPKEIYIGLTDAEVVSSREKYGRNVLTPPMKTPIWKLFLEKFKDPLIIILVVICVFSIGVSVYEFMGLGRGLDVFVEPVGILIAILLATGVGFYFELKAQNEFNLLNQENDVEKYPVVRNGNVVEVPKCDIVVGDILVLQTGQEVPADAELLETVNLMVDESSLTGEPVHGKSADLSAFDDSSTYPSNKIYRGTQVMEGHGYAKVLAVGDLTENGRIMMSLTGVELEDDQEMESDGLTETQRKALRLSKRHRITKKIKTPLNEQLGRLGNLISNISYGIAGGIIVGRMLGYFGWELELPMILLILLTVGFIYVIVKLFDKMKRWQCITVLLVFFLTFIGLVLLLHESHTDKDMDDLMQYALETIMLAVTLIVVAVPEGLPMAVSLALANSMRKMLKTNNLVRKMHACETMGACTMICTDKTGTLTQNQMQVRATSLKEGMLLFEGISVNSTAAIDNSGSTPRGIGNPTECALLIWMQSKKMNYQDYKVNARRIAEVPFSTELKYMATYVESGVKKGKRILYVKGAPEIVLDMCSHYEDGHTRADYEQILANYQRKAMRTLAFGYKIVEDNQPVIQDGKVIANDLCFLGVVGIEDPVRDDVKDAVAQCIHAGIKIKMITGDTMTTACEVGRQIGIWDETCDVRNVIDGPHFAELSDEELLERVEDLVIISRARPMDKKRLVEALQKKNHVVAVTGDGTNDAPALNAAHVGLSMGSGTSVAKEASDITIKDNSFASIARAVKWGRSLYQNIQRFLLYQLTVNVSACLLVLFGAFMGMKPPLTVTQMLWVNLIMDTFAAFALSGLPPTDKVMDDKPRSRRAFILDKDLLKNIFGVGLAFSVLLIGLLYLFQHYDITKFSDIFLWKEKIGVYEIDSYELTLLFTIFVMTHFWYLFNARAFKTGKSGFNLKGCYEFIVIAVIIFFGQILIVQVPVLNQFFNVEGLPWTDWLIIAVISFLVVFVREIYSWIVRRSPKHAFSLVALFMVMSLAMGSRHSRANDYRIESLRGSRTDAVESSKSIEKDNASSLLQPCTSINPEALLCSTKLPKGVSDQRLKYQSFYLSYNKETMLPNWAGWHLTAEHTDGPVGRMSNFHEEVQVPLPRATLADYKGSGWSRGHMCPAGDNKWSQEAMYETFTLANVCPQNANLNNGLWNSIENDCRKWARRFQDVYVVCGPLFLNRAHDRIGANGIPVPEAFFKVVLCLNGKPKAFGFIVRNRDGNQKRDLYYNSIDEVERIMGYDFFSALPDDIENEVEAKADINEWK